MSIQAQVSLRSRKLGVLIRDARISARKSVPECAQTLGVTPGVLRSWEEGRKSPSLPDLEVLSYALGCPLRRFWGREARSDDQPVTGGLNLPVLVNLRQKLIGAMLRQEREKAGISLHDLAEQSGVSQNRLKAYELGRRPIPLPELEGLIALSGGQIEALFDQTGPIGMWMNQQKSIEDFLQLPANLQNFVTRPINRPYLDLALKLSDMSTDKLRSVAENILDITL